MALDYDLSKIKDSEKLCFKEVDGEKKMNSVTHVIIFGCMAVGIPEITEKNAGEFYLRAWIMQRIDQPWIRESDRYGMPKERMLSREDVVAHIGLKTNATRGSTAWFKGKVHTMAFDIIARDARRAAHKKGTA